MMKEKEEIIEKKIIEMFVIKIKGKLASVNNRMFFREEIKAHLSDLWEQSKDLALKEQAKQYEDFLDKIDSMKSFTGLQKMFIYNNRPRLKKKVQSCDKR